MSKGKRLQHRKTMRRLEKAKKYVPYYGKTIEGKPQVLFRLVTNFQRI